MPRNYLKSCDQDLLAMLCKLGCDKPQPLTPKDLAEPHAIEATSYMRTTQSELGVMLQERLAQCRELAYHPLGWCTTCLSYKDCIAAKVWLIPCCRR